MRLRSERRYWREVKAWRRIKEDRQEHAEDRTCPCFGDEDRRVWGKTFARFADTPKRCSCWGCGNPRRYGKTDRLTLDERRDHERVADELRDLHLDVDEERMRRILGVAVGVWLALAGFAEAQRVSPSGGVTGLTTWGCATTNRIPYMDAAATTACSELERTDANTVSLLSTSGHYRISTDYGWKRGAAGSGYFTDGSTGHATGLGLGTATPKTFGTWAPNSAIHVTTSNSAGALLGVSTTAGGGSAHVGWYNAGGTANQRMVIGYLDTTTFHMGRHADSSGAGIDFLSVLMSGPTLTLGSASVAGLTASWGTGGGIALTDSANGKAVNIKQITESHTLAAAATSDTTVQFPAGAIVLGVAIRVTTTITGCATLDVGVSGATTRYGTGIALTAGTTNQSGGTTNPSIPGAAQSVRFTCTGGGGSFTAGVVRAVGYYIDMTPPTSLIPESFMRTLADAGDAIRRAARSLGDYAARALWMRPREAYSF